MLLEGFLGRQSGECGGVLLLRTRLTVPGELVREDDHLTHDAAVRLPGAQLSGMRRGVTSFDFFSVTVSTPSLSSAVILSWAILLDNVKARWKCPTLYSV